MNLVIILRKLTHNLGTLIIATKQCDKLAIVDFELQMAACRSDERWDVASFERVFVVRTSLCGMNWTAADNIGFGLKILVREVSSIFAESY